ncbi:MAG: hypothetical protein ABSB11_06210 [Sedimentisphaerales bacterium]|jgi:type II secretory pathway component PulK
MKMRMKNNGVVFLIVIFAIALLTTITVGILIMSTEELLLMDNKLYATQAMCTAEAGLNAAFAQIRSNSGWTTGFTNISFNGGSYTVTVTGTQSTLTIISIGTSSQGYMAQLVANVTVGATSPYKIMINRLGIN